jgi:hypothetical protein
VTEFDYRSVPQERGNSGIRQARLQAPVTPVPPQDQNPFGPCLRGSQAVGDGVIAAAGTGHEPSVPGMWHARS